jgi:hypothetical protein
VISLPKFALAVRQPWAWGIIYAGKPVENRSWRAWKKDWQFRARVAILASQGMTRAEYEQGRDFMASLGVTCPAPADLVRGAIIGHVNIVGNVWKHESPWFFGPGALVLEDPIALDEPVPVDGRLDIFEWKRAARPICEPAKWMLPAGSAVQGGLL